MRRAVPIADIGPKLRRVQDGLANESLYSRLNSFFSIHVVDLRDTKITPSTSTTGLFGDWRHTWFKPVADLLGCSEMELSRMRAQHLRALAEPVRYLRFCKTCLLAGYHAAAFQHVAMVKCPRHGEPLCEVCPFCSRQIVPTLRQAFEDPFLCPHCVKPLSMAQARRDLSSQAVQCDQAMEGVADDLCSAAQTCRPTRLDGWWRDGVVAVRHRQVARRLSAGVGSAHLAFPWRFEAEDVDGGNGSFRGAGDVDACVGGVESYLRWLSTHCPAASEAADLIESIAPTGAPVDLPLSVLAVALFKTLVSDDLEEAFYSIHRYGTLPRSGLGVWHGMLAAHAPPPDNVQFRDRMSNLELMGHLAVQIARSRPRSLMVDVPLITGISSIEYKPFVLPNRSKSQVLVRRRADENTLLRLFRRYAGLRYRQTDAQQLADRSRVDQSCSSPRVGPPIDVPDWSHWRKFRKDDDRSPVWAWLAKDLEERFGVDQAGSSPDLEIAFHEGGA